MEEEEVECVCSVTEKVCIIDGRVDCAICKGGFRTCPALHYQDDKCIGPRMYNTNLFHMWPDVVFPCEDGLLNVRMKFCPCCSGASTYRKFTLAGEEIE